MRVKDRSDVAYVIIKADNRIQPYDLGDSVQAEHFHVDFARLLLDEGVIAEVLPGQTPEEVLKEISGESPEPDVPPSEDVPQSGELPTDGTGKLPPSDQRPSVKAEKPKK